MHNIYIYDEFSPEDMAMMQALYSRSQESVTQHIEKVKETGSGKFMEKFYIGYGHKSIADCGSTTIFIENVSILAAKAIQDWPLYSGQESSTRYIDYANRIIIDPVQTEQSKQILDDWMQFYLTSQDDLIAYLKDKYPRKDGEKKSIYNRAIKARSFDILRGFLPAGVTTQLSWHTNLRQAWDKLSLLKHHPLQEVRNIANTILQELKAKYKNSFNHKSYEQTEAYNKLCSKYTYNTEQLRCCSCPCHKNPFVMHDSPCCIYKWMKFNTTINTENLNKQLELINNRPPKTNLPYQLHLGLCNFKFLIDFGSFRDLQRHRNGVCKMPLLTTSYDFDYWYLSNLPHKLKSKALELIKVQEELINKLDCDNETKQYYIAMGYNVVADVTYGLPALIYMLELRSGITVHPTLRNKVHIMVRHLESAFPELKMHIDFTVSDWDIDRGNQTIILADQKPDQDS